VAEKKRRDREELRKRQRLHLAKSSRWPGLDLADLRFERYYVEHMPTGERYRICRREILEARRLSKGSISSTGSTGRGSPPSDGHRSSVVAAARHTGFLRVPQCPHHTRTVNIRGTKADVVVWAFVSEVSVLSNGTTPAEPLAEVLSIKSSPAAVTTTSDRAVVGGPVMTGRIRRQLREVPRVR
jgi:hypothetical protein